MSNLHTLVWERIITTFSYFTEYNAFSVRLLEYWLMINCFIEVFQISDSSSDSNSGDNQGSDADDENEEFEGDTDDSESDTDDGDDADFDDIYFELSEDASNL